MDDGDIRPRTETGPAPLSFAQELLWMMDRASPGLTAWNVPRALRLRGRLDVDALQRTLDAVVSRHDILRTVFSGSESDARQTVLDDATVQLRRVDLSALPADARNREADRLVQEHALTPFDLTKDMLLRAMLITLGPAEHILCLNSHHIVSDGWSKSVLFSEMSTFYNAFTRGQKPELKPLPIQFADYAAWERAALHEQALAEPLAYWREQLAGPLPTIALPTDHVRPQVTTFGGARRVMVLPTPLVTAMGDLARQHGVTPYMVLLAAYVTLLHRYTGQDDIIVGSPIAGRSQPETEELIGYLANTMILRNRLDGDPTFAELLVRVRETALGAFDHQDVPFEKLVLELQKGAQLTHAPLFQVVLTMEDTVPARLQLGDLEIETLALETGATKFDLTLLVAEQPDGLRLSLWYRTDLFESDSVERMLGHLQRIIESAVGDATRRISELPMLTPNELAWLNVLAHHEAIAPPDETVPARFAKAAARTPDATAVVSGHASLSYGELQLRANALATRLRAEGVTRGASVGIALDRSAELIVAILGVFAVGGVYVPLPPDVPAARVRQQVAESGIGVIITDAAHLATMSEEGVRAIDIAEAGTSTMGDAAAPEELSLDDVAYVLFTSGSTGVPKGVAVTHRNLAHYVDAIAARMHLPGIRGDGAPYSYATVSTLGADLGNTAIYPALASGGTLHVLSSEVTRDPTRFAEYMTSHDVDVLKITPSHLRALVAGRHGAQLAAVLPRQWLVLGGEAATWDLVRDVLAAERCRVLNHYGPTETTVGATAVEITREIAESAQSAGSLTVPIGTPLPNVSVYVVDARGVQQPVGVPGELWIGGPGVARGYINRPDLTAERFANDPFHDVKGERIYKTGDRVRWLSTGSLEFIGRLDGQVKVRGYRVEIGEVEHTLAEHPGVAQSVVVLQQAPGGDNRLVAYVVSRSGGYSAAHAGRVTSEQVTQWLATRLPEYMVPSVVMILESLPLTANGKVDRRALPDPEAAAPEDTYVAPSTETEKQIAAIWMDVLKRDRVGIAESFMSLGGHSLLAIRVLGKLSKLFGVRLPLRALFDTPTIAELASVVDAEVNAAKQRELDALLQSLDGMSDADVQRMMTDTEGTSP